tara:strand:+ start:31448 stop:31810 length:363 start_codon:yes stop_codon:yes gene_type:complete
MFFPFTNYKRINVPRIPASGGTPTLIYTTTAKCEVSFEPRSSDMRIDRFSTIRANNVWSYALSGSPAQHEVIWSKGSDTWTDYPDENRKIILPAGILIYAYFGDTFDLIGGTLHIFELPE